MIKLQTWLFQPILVMIGLALAFTLFKTFLYNEGFARSVSRQFIGGFLGASLLPLGFLVFLATSGGTDRGLNLRQQADDHLQEEFQNWTERVKFHYTPRRHQQSRVFQQSPIKNLLATQIAQNFPENPDHEKVMTGELKKLFNICKSPPQYRMDSLSLIGPRNIVFQINNRGETASASNPLARTFSIMGKRILERLNPEEFRTQTTPNAARQEILNEMAANMMFDIFESAFGPVPLLEVIFGFGRESVLSSGEMDLIICPHFLPDDRKPQGIIFSVYSRYYSTIQASRRVLHDPIYAWPQRLFPTPFQLAAFERGTPGNPGNPILAERKPFLRQAARAVISSGGTISNHQMTPDGAVYVQGKADSSVPMLVVVGAALEEVFIKAVARQQLMLYALVLAFLGILVFAAATISRDLSDPVTELCRGLEEVEKGNFSVQLPRFRHDEIGHLFASFNEMTQGLLEREKLARLVSASAREASASDEAEQKALEGVRKPATVLYLAVPHFDTYWKTFATNEIADNLNRWVQVACREIMNNGGDVDKILGDKILAVFPESDKTLLTAKEHTGSPRALAVINACRTALCLQSLGKDPQMSFPTVAGLARGDIIFGFMGGENRRDYTIIGDTVNSAARCAGVAETLPNAPIVVTSGIRDELPLNARLAPLAIEHLKGKQEKVSLFSLTGLFPEVI